MSRVVFMDPYYPYHGIWESHIRGSRPGPRSFPAGRQLYRGAGRGRVPMHNRRTEPETNPSPDPNPDPNPDP